MLYEDETIDEFLNRINNERQQRECLDESIKKYLNRKLKKQEFCSVHNYKDYSLLVGCFDLTGEEKIIISLDAEKRFASKIESKRKSHERYLMRKKEKEQAHDL